MIIVARPVLPVLRLPSILLAVVALIMATTVALVRAGGPVDAATTLTVTSVGDEQDDAPGDGVCQTVLGDCTLRAAIEEANALAGVDTIAFALPGVGPHRVMPGSPLPSVTAEAIVDGRTQPGHVPGGPPLVVLDGAAGSVLGTGLTLAADRTEVYALAIGGFSAEGLYLDGDDIVVRGMHLGLDADGASVLGNGDDGLDMSVGSDRAMIGGGAPEDGNVISGNTQEGIILRGTDHLVLGNTIGTDRSGSVPLGGTHPGITVFGTGHHTIGGPGAGEGNHIAGNGSAGFGEIELRGGSADILGNLLGLLADGTTPAATAQDGVYVDEAATGRVVIGGTDAAAGNTIGGVLGSGVRHASNSDDVVVLGNVVLATPRVAVDLVGGTEDAFGVTANDVFDADGGPNGLLNAPVVSVVSSAAAEVAIDVPAGRYRIEVYALPSGAHASGHGPLEAVAGATEVSHQGVGSASYTVTGLTGVAALSSVSATVTRCSAVGCAAPQATSEPSATVAAVAAATLSGTVYEDVDGDGAVADDGVGVAGVEVRVFLDDGDGVPDAGDSLVGTTTSAAGGAWSLRSGAVGTLWVAIGAAGVTPSAGLTGGFSPGDVLAEQTWGASGAATFSGSWSFRAGSGPVLGGARIGVSDGFPALDRAEHVLRTSATGTDLSGLDVGFSFVAVTTTSDEVAQDTFGTTAGWQSYDPSTVVGTDPRGFEHGVFDGRYLYLAPDTNGSGTHGEVLRHDTTSTFGDPAAWTSFDAAGSGLSGDPRGYAGGAFDGRYVYFAPELKDGVGDHSTVLRYDTAAPFGAVGSWATFDPNPGLPGDPARFNGAVFDGRYIVFAPGSGRTEALRYDTTGAFGSIGSWESFDLAAGGVAGDLGGYEGSIGFDGRFAYWTTSAAGSGEVLRLDTAATFASAASWTTYDPTDDGIGRGGNRGMVLAAGALYLVPFDDGAPHGEVLRHDLAGSFGDPASWTSFDPAVGAVGAGYDGGAFDGRHVYFVPASNGAPHGEVLRLDTTGTFTDGASWSAFDPGAAGVGVDSDGFDGALFDGRAVYFVPDQRDTGVPSGEALRLDVPPRGQGSLRTVLANAAAIQGRQTTAFGLSTADAGHAGGVWTIATSDALRVTSDVDLDARTQPGWTSAPLVRLDGSSHPLTGPDADGVRVEADGAALAGVSVTRAPGDGVVVDGGDVVAEDVWIGRTPEGVTLGNGANGVLVTADGGDVQLRSSIVVGNAGDGVRVTGLSPTAITSTVLVGNGGLAVDLGGDGADANDPDDVDTGPNERRNHPTVALSLDADGAASGAVTLDTVPGSYRIDVFANPSAGSASTAEAELLVASTTVTSATGDVTVSMPLPGVAAGDHVTLTTTDVVAGTPVRTSEVGPGTTVVVGGASATRTQLDVSPGREDGRTSGSMTSSDVVPGAVGDGLDLDGVDDRVTLVGPGTDGSALTVSLWARPDGDGSIVARGSAAGDVWRIARVAGELQAHVDLGAGAVTLAGPALPAGARQHVALVIGAGTASLYLDGVLVDAAPVAGQLPLDPAVRTVVGGRGDGASPAFDGVVDELRIRQLAVSAAVLRTEVDSVTTAATATSTGAVQRRTAARWSVDPTQGRTGSHALRAPSQQVGAWLTRDGLLENGLEVRGWWKAVGTPGDIGVGVRATPPSGPVQDEATLGPQGWGLSRWNGAATTLETAPAGQTASAAWRRLVLRTDQTGALSGDADGTVLGPVSGPGVAPSGTLGLRAGYLGGLEGWWLDDLSVRRFVSPEPTTGLGPMQPAP